MIMRVGTLLCVALAVVAGGALIAREAAPSLLELSEGHADIGPAMVNGRWQIQIKDDSGLESVWRDPDKVFFRVGDAAQHSLPESDEFAFLGQPGQDVFLIPQTQLPEVIWLGWNTQHPSLLEAEPRRTTFTLTSAEGPGQVHVYFDYGGFRPPEQIWDSDRMNTPLDVLPDTHAHANWAFTAPGAYTLDFHVDVIDHQGQKHTVDEHLHFAVGDQTPTPSIAAGWSPTAVGASVGAIVSGVLALTAYWIRGRKIVHRP